MPRRFFTLIPLLTIIISCQGGSNVTGETSRTDKGAVIDSLDADLVTANTAFAMNLFGDVVTDDAGQNVLISAPSVAVALAMTYNGADGSTRAAMADALQIKGIDLDKLNQSYADLVQLLQNPDTSLTLTIANSLWARQGMPFNEDFLQRNKDYYDARIEALDFNSPEAAKTINGWVNDQTHGKIRKIVDDPIDPSLIMFLINAIYFKGTWTNEFDKSDTRDWAFTRGDGSLVMHPLMHTNDSLRYMETEDFQAVSIPYGSERLSMYVFLPSKQSNLGAFLAQLDADHWTTWMRQFKYREGELALPRFKFEYKKSVKPALTNLGMGVAFNSGEANFGKMFPISSGQNVYISDVKHKTYIEVNEQGTEAAAVTSVEMGITSVGPDPRGPFHMIIDRPFMFAIRDNKTGIILFMGVITDPSNEGG